MRAAQFRQADRRDVLRLHARTFEHLNLSRFLWQPCQQVESLEKESIKVVWREEGVKGYAAAYHTGRDGFRLNLLVDPRHTQRGVGTSLLGEVEAEVYKCGGRHLEARLLEGAEASLAFAISRGFAEVHRMRGVSLLADDFSFEKWKGLGERLSAGGFTVTTLGAEAEAGHNALDKLVSLQRRALAGWFHTGPAGEPETSTDHLRALFSSVALPGRVSIMKRGERYVAYTSAERKNMLGTAVDPEYRGLGLATYLKACDLKRLIDAGAGYFETSSANPAMLRVNEKLGYKLNGLAEVRLAKRL